MFVTLVIFGLTASQARAQYFIEGGKEVLAVSGGERINKSVIIHNSTAENISLKASWEDFQYEPPFDGTKSFVPAGTGTRSLSQWISFSSTPFIIPPFGQQQLNYTLSVPAVIKDGYYGVLFVERAGDPENTKTGLQIITRVGSLFFVEPKDAVRKAQIRDIAIAGTTLKGIFHNQSTVVLIPKMTYYFMDEQGVVADRGDIKALYLPPDGAGNFEIALPAGLAIGKNTLVINAELEDNNVVVKEVEITKDAAANLTILNTRD